MPQQPGPERADRTTRPDASMWLLNEVMDHPLDAGYEEAARRRAAAGGPAPGGRRLWLIAGLLLTAMVITLGALQTRAGAPALAQERRELAERVERGTDQTEALQQEVDDLRDHVAELRRAALTGGSGGAAELTALLAGAIAVTGPGLELVLDDAEGAGDALGGGPRDGGGFADTGRLRDRDLQRIVNGLWSAGAEAVAVNGQRLTAVSAIRAAGDAVLVDNRPLVPPYTVHAVGDGETLRGAFEAGAGGATLESLREHYGIRGSLTERDELRLPAASRLVLRSATPVGPGVPEDGDGPDPSGTAAPEVGDGSESGSGETGQQPSGQAPGPPGNVGEEHTP
ncbi:DUF881 domain-containing protein [Streptomyces bohaiensis]|uniref:DUF881 domain-containing protein n=1 Tax=Streptomyces bohaiensis TaxID=1431344 RepID=UPI003B7AD20F